MDAWIAADIPGRLRLRLARGGALGPSDQSRLAAELEKTAAEISRYNHRTQSLLILYPAGAERRRAILAIAASFQAAGGDWPAPEDAGPGPLGPLAWHLARKLLPAPLRLAWSLVSASPYLARGLLALSRARLNVDLLDASALGLCLWRRDFRAVGSLLFFFTLGRRLEDWTRRRSRAGLWKSLAGRREKVWLKLPDGREQLVEESALSPGDLILIRAGGLISADGQVTEGEALVNQSAMTGEALPVPKKIGDMVWAGTSVAEGELAVRAVRVGAGTRFQSLIRYIEATEASQAGLEGRARHLADSLAPFSFLLSGLIFWLTGQGSRAANVFLVDYSCAIRLITPVTVMSALREASEHGLLIKGGRCLEALAEADVMIFDKTGTLTEARPQVAAVRPFNGFSRSAALRLAACLEEHFPHPVGRAVVRQAREENLNHKEEHASVKYVVAHGIASTWRGREVLLGSRHFVADDRQTPLTAPEEAAADQEAAQGHSLLYLAVGGRLAALIAIRDRLRPRAKEVLAALRAEGLTHSILLTGDVEAVAAPLARSLDFDDCRARLLPEDKSAVVEELIRRGRRTLMVGDGLNDSAALARAHVSLALNDGSALAREVADVLILDGRLDTILTARHLARAARRRLRRQYRFIVAANTIFLALGVAGLTGPGLTAFLHNATTALAAAWGAKPLLKLETDG